MTSNDLAEQVVSLRRIAAEGYRFAGDAADTIECLTRALADTTAENRQLRDALEKAADTFADFNKGMRSLNRPLLADACEIAERESRAALIRKL
jgi:hypothetical protein